MHFYQNEELTFDLIFNAVVFVDINTCSV
jgi:hypothetical protein